MVVPLPTLVSRSFSSYVSISLLFDALMSAADADDLTKQLVDHTFE